LYAKPLLFKLVLEFIVWKEQKKKKKRKRKTRMEWKTQVSGIAGIRDNFLFAPCAKTGIRFAMLSAGIVTSFL